MRVFVAFSFGILLGVIIVIQYTSKIEPKSVVFSQKDTSFLSPTVSETPRTTPQVLPLEETVTSSPTSTATPTIPKSNKQLFPKIPTVTATLTPSPLPTLTTAITASPSASSSPTQTPTPIPFQTASSQEINAFIDRFAIQYNVDPNVLRHIAICESGFNPNAVNGPYAGLYQFSINTWKKYRLEIGEDTAADLRFNAEEAVQTASYVLSKNQAYIWPSCVP